MEKLCLLQRKLVMIYYNIHMSKPFFWQTIYLNFLLLVVKNIRAIAKKIWKTRNIKVQTKGVSDD